MSFDVHMEVGEVDVAHPLVIHQPVCQVPFNEFNLVAFTACGIPCCNASESFLRENANLKSHPTGEKRLFREHMESLCVEDFSAQFIQRFYNDYLGEYTPYRGLDGHSSKEVINQPRAFIEPVFRQILTPSANQPSKFMFQPFLLKHIPKAPNSNETRPISKASIKSIVAQDLIASYVVPTLESHFLPNSFAYRKGKSAKQAVREVWNSVKSGYTVILDADIQKFFDNVDHCQLMQLVQETFPEDELLELLVYRFLKTGFVDTQNGVYTPEQGTMRSQKRGYTAREIGIPQGGILSPLLANLYLHPLDEFMAQNFPHLPYYRYADDFVVLGQDGAEMTQVYEELNDFLEEKLKLLLHPLGSIKTRVIDLNTPIGKTTPFVDFLGYRIRQDKLDIQPKNLLKFKKKTQQIIRRVGITNMPRLVDALNTRIEGHYWRSQDDGSPIFLGRNWCRYFSLVTDTGLFRHLDNWTINEIQEALYRRTGKHIAQEQLREMGLKTLVGLHFQMFKDSHREVAS